MGKSKNPNLPADLDKWTSDNFLTLKETLKECLPHIRYFSFSHDDVFEKLFPYQQILETQLWLDINTRLISPKSPISTIGLSPRKILNTTLPSRNKFPSNIITIEQALEISSWISQNPQKFKLLARGSRDGFDVKTIYNICDKVSRTIIILKVQGTGEILGGYNPLEWDKNKNKSKRTKDSFTFSLRTANQNYSILSRVFRNFSKAIYNYPKDSAMGFSLGLCLRGDLKRCYCKFNPSYARHIRPIEFIASIIPSKKALFSVEEYEVFEISPIIRTRIT
ncbi:hypothetical protein Glove_61g12 [Diversispora epigaea]|uniref:TLDc domain-containing protein n=1 Tax=Diversispora epigaea TaxID=1348612 RepID=A0A397JEZ2_9GLOM|nr:hypothetical protein Glove_61g12 [Diversispora epigaea]